MRSTLLFLVVVILAVSVDAARNCRNRYAEARGRDSTAVFPQQPCRGTNSQVSEEYWTTVGFDGQLRDGRTTDDFLKFPVDQTNEHQLDNAFIGYWEGPENKETEKTRITRSKYGEGRHYEAFGHVFVKPDGRVCGWFVGMNHEIVEVCGGFRVLSRNRRNPYEPIPFEWVQGEHLRNRDTLGFHHHRIAKYADAQNSQDIFFGDAQVHGKKFQGVSPATSKFVEITNPSDFTTRVWLLKKKNVVVPQQQRPQNIISSSENSRADLRSYDDPHEHAQISARAFPYYDQYGRPSSLRHDAERPAYDSYGRRIPFETYAPAPSRGDSDYADWLRRQHALRAAAAAASDDVAEEVRQAEVVAPAQYTAAQPPSRSDPNYEAWLRREYALRGLQPRAYPSGEQYQSQQQQQQPAAPQNIIIYNDGDASTANNQENGWQNVQEEQDAQSRQFYADVATGDNAQYVPATNYNNAAPRDEYYWPSGERKPASRDYSQVQHASAHVPNVANLEEEEAGEIHIPRGDEYEDARYRNVDVYGRPIQNNGAVRLARVKPQIIVRDRAGRTYRPWTDPTTGKVTYISDAQNNEAGDDDRNVQLPAEINADIERQLETERRRQLERQLREQINNNDETQRSRGETQESFPLTAAESARRSSRRHRKF